MFIKQLTRLMNAAGDGTGAAGGPPSDPLASGGTPPAPSTPPAGGGAPPAAPTVVIPENWKDALPAELKDAPALQAIKDIPNLAKAMINAQSLVGKEKIIAPAQNAPPEAWKEVFQKLGVPADVKDYAMGVDHVVAKVDKEFLEKFKVAAHAQGVLPRQATELVKWFGQLNHEIMTNEAVEYNKRVAADFDTLKTDWGSAYDRKIAGIKHVVKDLVGEESAKAILTSGIGLNTGVLRLLDAVYKLKFGENAPRGDGYPEGTETPEQATAKYKELMAPKGPYWDKNHHAHSSTVQEVQRLIKIANAAKKSS